MKLMLILLMVSLASLHCGTESDENQTAEKRVVIDESPPDPPSIDPNREEMLRSGSELDKLLVKYELLVDRIRLERQNDVYNANVALNKGLIPIADDHHDLLKKSLIDTTLHLEISMLAVHVLADHLNMDNDPGDTKFQGRMEKIRTMIPDHAEQD